MAKLSLRGQVAQMNGRVITGLRGRIRSPRSAQSVVVRLAILFGVVMPIISALLFPTYMHSMREPWQETMRLLEMPFVVAEILVILWASNRGMDSFRMVGELPRDVRIAVGVMLFGLFASSIFISNQPVYSLTISMITVIHMYFAIALVFLLRADDGMDLQRFLPWHGIGLVALSFYTVWWFATPPPESEVLGGKIEWPSALPGFISVRHFGSWTGAIAAGFAIKILFDDDPDRLDFGHFFYLLAASMTVWSGTRAAVLAMVAVLLILSVSVRRWPSIRAIGRACVLTGLALCIAWLLLPDHPAFYLFEVREVESFDQFTSRRSELWSQTFSKWMESPWLGWGSGSTFWEVYIGWPHTQPHNAILQFLISWGIVGAGGTLWLLGRATVTAHRLAIGNRWLLPLLGMLYALLFQSLFEGMLHYPRFIISIILALVVLIEFGRRHKDAGSHMRATANER